MRHITKQKMTYRPRDKEAREQVPEAQEEGHHNGSDLVARRQRYNHHPVHCEVDEAHQYVVVEPQELPCLPLEPDHHVKEKTVD